MKEFIWNTWMHHHYNTKAAVVEAMITSSWIKIWKRRTIANVEQDGSNRSTENDKQNLYELFSDQNL